MESSSEKELSLTEEFLQMVEKECKGFVRNLHQNHSDSDDNILTSDHSLKQKRRKSRKKRKRDKNTKRSDLSDSIEIMDVTPDRLPFIS